MINPKVKVTIGGGILVFKLYSTVTERFGTVIYAYL